jgi:hypothetical protein
MGEQRHDEAHRLGRSAQAVKHRACWLDVEVCQEEYGGSPIFVTSEFHHA